MLNTLYVNLYETKEKEGIMKYIINNIVGILMFECLKNKDSSGIWKGQVFLVIIMWICIIGITGSIISIVY